MPPLPTFSSITTGITQALSPDGFTFEILLGLLSYAGLPGNWWKLPGALSVIYASVFLIWQSLFVIWQVLFAIWQIGKLVATILEDELGFRGPRIHRTDSSEPDFSATNLSESPTANQQTSQQSGNHEPEVPVSYSSEAPTADQQTSQQDDDEEQPAALGPLVTGSSESSTTARQ